jgi:hypothetical protein
MTAWPHQLTARTAGEDILAGHGVRGGRAMIATLRWRLICHASRLVLPLPPGHELLPEVMARLRELPAPPDLRPRAPAPGLCPRPASPDPQTDRFHGAGWSCDACWLRGLPRGWSAGLALCGGRAAIGDPAEVWCR